MELTKESLKSWIKKHPSISQRELAKESGLHPDAIRQMYNAMNRNLTESMKVKILPVIKKYGWIE